MIVGVNIMIQLYSLAYMIIKSLKFVQDELDEIHDLDDMFDNSNVI